MSGTMTAAGFDVHARSIDGAANCGHPAAYRVDLDDNLTELQGPDHPALGRGDAERTFQPAKCQLRGGERLILLTDGITERHTGDGGTFGVEGLRRALERAESPTAAATALAVQRAVTDCWSEPLEDDATVVVLRRPRASAVATLVCLRGGPQAERDVGGAAARWETP